ncbi:MAG: hypothetical protein GY835_24620 [bacterium]|nr:hypothetical protein [bacterium]
MGLQDLSLENLPAFADGAAQAAWAAALEAIVSDCIDRPGNDKAREVVMTTYVTPRPPDAGGGLFADVEFKITTRTPPFKTFPVMARATHSNQLMFSEMSPDHPDQMTIDDAATR